MKANIGYPTVGWAPPGGYAGDNIVTSVTHESAVQGINTFSAGIRLIAEDIASMPLIVYERLANGKRRAPEHPAYTMLHDAPNPEMTSMVFRETGIGHLYSWGDWFAERELNGVGTTVRLWPLRPDRMTVTLSDAGKREYRYRLPDGTGAIIPANRIFHVPGFGFDGLRGYSRVKLMRRALEAAVTVEEYGLRTFANGAQPGVVIRHKEQLPPAAKLNIAASWDAAHSGLSNAQRTAVLDEGMELDQIGFPPQDAQFLDSRLFSVVEIARGLRLAPHKLSDMSRATFSNIEESNIDHVVGTLGPPAMRIEQQINKDIIGDRRYFVEHLFDQHLRGRMVDRVAAEVQLRLNGLATEDELRAIENRNPLTDEERRGLLVPLNSIPASSYDAHGMTVAANANAAGVLARAGYDPAAVLVAFNLPAIPHTGFLPVTVQTEPLLGKDTEPDEIKEAKAPEFHMHVDAGAFVNEIHTAPVTIAKGAVQLDVKSPDVTIQPADVRVNIEAPKSIKRTRTPIRDASGRITSVVEE